MLQNLVLDSTLASIMTGLALVLGLVIWFLIRKKRQRIWMPILRIMDRENKLLPKMTYITPPWLAFLCFLLCALVVGFYSFKPRQKVFTPFEPNQTHVHIYFDMSPSVASLVTMEQYSQIAKDLLTSMGPVGRITFASTHDNQVFDMTSAESTVEKLTSLGFHREGLKLGESLKSHMEQLGDANVIIVVSDGHQTSWEDFNWSYLEDEVEVRYFDLNQGQSLEGVSNFYIEQVNAVSKPASELAEWDVIIARSGRDIALSGTLKVTYGQLEIYTGSWSLPAGRESVDLRVRWPTHRMKAIIDDRDRSEPLVWTIVPEAFDKGQLDNTFRTYPTGAKRNILLIGDHGGESFLDDPVHHLRIGLQVLGFNVTRLDRFPIQPHPFSDFPAWIVLAGGDQNIDEQCPLYPTATDRNSDLAVASSSLTKPLKWLAPFQSSANWRIMCRCFSRFAGFETSDEPEFCKEVETREQYISVLRSVGGKQVGGGVNDVTTSIAWHFKNSKSKDELLMFTVPLKPDLATGISYAQLPLLLKTLVGWQNLSIQKEIEKSNWPRVKSIASLYQDAAASPADLRLSNVPLGESQIKFLAKDVLPAPWNPQTGLDHQPYSTKKDTEDPLPILKWLLLAIIAIFGLEAGFVCIKLILNLTVGRDRAKISQILVVVIVVFLAKSVRAEIDLHILGETSSQISATRLSREIAARTSITMNAKIDFSPTFDQSTLTRPWIWTYHPKLLQDPNNLLKPEVVAWIKRGGFLVIENGGDTSVLQQMTATNEFILHQGEGWSEIPPDHELMRSFHLLDSLPPCGNQLWYGYKFDGRLAILAIPGGFIRRLTDQVESDGCQLKITNEQMVRTYVNILMVALATDYKKDQIHLPEILKRLR